MEEEKNRDITSKKRIVRRRNAKGLENKRKKLQKEKRKKD